MKKGNKGLGHVAFALLVIGGVNWGLVGAFDFNLVNVVFGSVAWLETTVYILVGLSALYVASIGCACCKKDSSCKGGKCCK